MGAFKRFEPGDQVDNVLILEPAWVLSSGSSGWRGSPEGSASVSLYGGYNRQPEGVVREYIFQRTIQGTDSFGKLSRSGPITASVNFVYMTSEERPFYERSNTRWGYEHWKTVMRLYDYYERRSPDYVTASYDHYCLYFQKDSRNVVRFSAPTSMTASYTIESWVKPFLTSSVDQDFTIANMNRMFWFGIDGSSGRLALTNYNAFTTVTSSVGVPCGDWTHVSARFDATTGTGSFAMNGVFAGTFILPSLQEDGFNHEFSIGNILSGTGSPNDDEGFTAGYSSRGELSSFHGFIGETRLWYLYRSDAQLSSSMGTTLTGSAVGVTGSIICARLNEGPLATFPTSILFGGDATYVAPTAMGSGTVNASAMEQSKSPSRVTYPWGWLCSFDDRPGPGWHPNDNINFYVPKKLAGPPVCDPVSMTNMSAAGGVSGSGYADVSRMLVATVPAGMYGRRIVPNTVSIRCKAFSDQSYGLVRTLIDDGRGGLFLSGSARLNPAGAGAATGSYVVTTSSISFVSRFDGPAFNGIGITQTQLGPMGSPNWGLNESDPYNMVLTVPCEFDGFTPSANMWSLYQFFGTSSHYIRPTAITAPNDAAGSPFFTLGGGTFGNQALAFSGSYRGVEWNKVGNVFYDEGLIVIKDPALLDFAAPWTAASEDPSVLLDLAFHGESRIPVKTFMCRIDRGDINASLNQTFWDEEEDGDRIRRHPSGSLYVSTVGLYNSDRELVGVARLAEPLRVRPRDRMNIKLRMDF